MFKPFEPGSPPRGTVPVHDSPDPSLPNRQLQVVRLDVLGEVFAPESAGLNDAAVHVDDIHVAVGPVEQGGRTEPLVLNVEHLDVAIPNADLRVVVSAFEPAAQGACYGTRETGSIFFQGVLRRSEDQLDVPLTF